VARIFDDVRVSRAITLSLPIVKCDFWLAKPHLAALFDATGEPVCTKDI
jgi:hypothetical protein